MRTEAERREEAIASLKAKRVRLMTEWFSQSGQASLHKGAKKDSSLGETLHELDNKIGTCDVMIARLEVGESINTILIDALAAKQSPVQHGKRREEHQL